MWDIQNSIDVYGWLINIEPNPLTIITIIYDQLLDVPSTILYSVLFNSFPNSKIVFKIEKKYISLKNDTEVFFVGHPEFYRRLWLVQYRTLYQPNPLTIITIIYDQLLDVPSTILLYNVIFNSFPISKIVFKTGKKYSSLK